MIGKITVCSLQNCLINYSSYRKLGLMSLGHSRDVDYPVSCLAIMTLRVRLTLWYTLLLAVVLVLFAVLFHTVLARTLSRDIEETLQVQAHQIVTVFEADINPTRANLPTTIVLGSQVLAQATTTNGSIIDTSASLGDRTLPLPDSVLAMNIQGKSSFYTWRDDTATIRIYSAPVQTPRGVTIAAVQVGQSMETIQTTLKMVRLSLLVGGLAALFVAAIGGALLSGSALRPLNEIAETTSRIAEAKDLGQRLETPSVNDEVGRLTETFNQMMARLEQLFSTQHRLVADVSHELRTPLATMQGNLDLLSRGAADDPQMLQESLGAIKAEVARMRRLVRDLLILAEADAGVQLSLRPVEMDTLLLEVYREALLMAGDRVKVRLGHEDQALVAGDPDRLRQLLRNLVSNAIKYTPAGGVVTLSLYCQPNNWVRVTVADTGVGIAPEDQPHIFDRFWREDRARNRDAGGTGLGLSIAKWITEAHGGQIKLDSAPGRGSVFEILLPKAEGPGCGE